MKFSIGRIAVELIPNKFTLLTIGNGEWQITRQELADLAELASAASQYSTARSQTAGTSGTPVFDAMASESDGKARERL